MNVFWNYVSEFYFSSCTYLANLFLCDWICSKTKNRQSNFHPLYNKDRTMPEGFLACPCTNSVPEILFLCIFFSRYILNYFFSWEIFCISLVDAYIIMLWWYHNFFHASSLAFQGRKKYTKVHTSGLWKNWLPVSCCTSGFV